VSVSVALRRIVPRPLRLQASAALARHRRTQLERELSAIAASGEPIVAGPWLGEVGFELLYWVPFLAWFAQEFDVAPDRVLIISRGGTAAWYRRFASHYADVFDAVTPERFRQEHDRRVRELGEQKQTRLTAFDQELVDAAVRGVATVPWQLLHPSRMYDALNPFWWGHVPIDWVHGHARYAPLSTSVSGPASAPASALAAAPRPAGAASLSGLPADYVAAKFYFNECFPATAANRQFVASMLEALSRRLPVVVLSTGLSIDDHVDGNDRRSGNHRVTALPEGIDPAHNLELQSAVVARARAVVGTYGGFSYLAPFFGVPSLGCYSDAGGFSIKHLDVARSAFERIGAGGLLHVEAAGNAALALAAIEGALG
jgi:hypothetical protein